MEANLLKLGSSLEVPNIQALAKENLSLVPPRYVRSDQQPLLPYSLSSLPQLPVVDFQKLLDGSSVDSELQLLHRACQDWGFFQLDWGDMFYVVTLPTHLRKPHLIPNKLPQTFKDAIEAYSSELKILAMKILDLMAKALNMKNEEMTRLFEEGMQAMRMNYYPQCPQPKLVTGLCPHSDAIGLTILLQVNEMEGLQVKKNGVWIPVSPLPDAFVINIGDILEMVTNGTYRSIEHRATVNSMKERLSIATFLSPKLDGNLGPAPSLVSHENPAKFKNIGVAEYFRGLFARELVGRSYPDTVRIN